MRFRRVTLPIIMLLLLGPAHLYAGPIFDSQAVEDEAGDAFNFDMCFYEGVLVPQPMELDVAEAEIVAKRLDPVELALEVTLAAPPLPHMSYTVELGLDMDQDPSTGASLPAAYYNGLGVELKIGMGVEPGGASSTWVERYEGGSWVRLGETRGSVEGAVVLVYIPLDLMSHPLDADGVVYLVSGGGLDMVPGVQLLFHYVPDAELTLDPPVVDEGSTCLLDASASSAVYGVAQIDWDLDGDGVYEEAGASITATFPGDGLYPVTVRVTDTKGFVDTRTRTVTVLNLPPAGLEAGYTGEAKVGSALTFTASAVDPGGDPLTYRWRFGDDSTGEGLEVAHTYTGSGFYVVMVTATDDAGSETTVVLTVEVAPEATQPPNGDGGGAGAPPVDPLLIVLIIVFGITGWFLYNFIRGKKKEEPPKKPEEKKKKGFCEEHPEVVEEETHKCDDALIDLDSAVGDVQDNFDDAEPRWRSNVNEIGRLLVEWDGVISLIAHWSKSEKAIKADAEKVQKVAGLVTSAGGMGKTAFKEGGEAAMKELGKDVAKDIAGSIAGELSSTVGDLLELEDWAIREIGLGIAKGLTGIDPKGNAVKLRKNSEVLLTQLLSWVDHSEAWNLGRRPPDTLPSMREEAEGMLKALDDAVKSFEDAVAGFVCVTCKIPENIQQEIDELRGKLEKWKTTFDDLEKQVQKRIDQARAMYKRKSLYESPYEYASKADRNIERIDRAREEGP